MFRKMYQKKCTKAGVNLNKKLREKAASSIRSSYVVLTREFLTWMFGKNTGKFIPVKSRLGLTIISGGE